MKKLFVMLFAMLTLSTVAKAADFKYTVAVSIQVEYEYYDGFNLVSTQNGGWENQTITVCASSPQEAREKAIDECDRMCRGKQRMGTTYLGGKEVEKYKIRKVYEASVKYEGPMC